MNAPDLVEATLLQSLWISNFKKSLMDTTISKVLARWFKNTLIHSTKETRTNPSYHPALANGHDMYYQAFLQPKVTRKNSWIQRKGPNSIWVPSLPYRSGLGCIRQ
jgi:hypothetical protein